MAIIDPTVVEKMKKVGIWDVKSEDGTHIGFQGSELPHVYEFWTEAFKANMDAALYRELRERGLNEHGQTPEQEAAYKKRKIEQEAKKERAVMGNLVAQVNA